MGYSWICVLNQTSQIQKSGILLEKNVGVFQEGITRHFAKCPRNSLLTQHGKIQVGKSSSVLQTQNYHRIVWVERDLKESDTPAMGRDTIP